MWYAGKNCKVYSSSLMLVPHDNIFQSDRFIEFVPLFEISDECKNFREKDSNFSEILVSEHYKILSRHIPELHIASHTLDDIEKLVDYIKKKNISLNHTFSVSITAYILAVLITLFILHKLFKENILCYYT